jgi:putative restriction endonuclease
VAVRRDILLERDGPMLRHGLQEMDGTTLMRPHRVDAQADRNALAERYRAFLEAS